MRLETERLLLRPLESADVERLVTLWADPSVTRFLGGPRDCEVVRAVLQEELAEPPLGPFGQWPLIEKDSGQAIGDCGLIEKRIDDRTEVELVYVLASSAWGKGYATEVGAALLRWAFDALGLDRVVSLIDTENAASCRVAEKLGMHRESAIVRPDGVERELWVVESAGD